MTSFSEFRSRTRFDSLDALRCISILAVLWHHSPRLELTPLTRGFLGVDLFFVLSGFLITTLLLREREDAGRISLKGFYWRRMLRIFPLYYAVLFLYAALMLFAKPGTGAAADFFEAMPWYLTYTAHWGPKEDTFAHAWSLSVEEQFYLLWPPLLVLLEPRRAQAVLLGFLAVVLALDLGVFGPATLELARKLAPFAAVAWGALLAVLLSSHKGFDRVAALVGARWFVAAPLVALAALVWIPGDIGGLPRLGIHLSMVALVAAVVVPPTHAMAGLFRHRMIVHIGMISYGVYLLHQLCNIAVYKLLAGVSGPLLTPVFFVLSTAITVLVATMSFWTFEAYFSRFKHAVGAPTKAQPESVAVGSSSVASARVLPRSVSPSPQAAPSRSTPEPVSPESVH